MSDSEPVPSSVNAQLGEAAAAVADGNRPLAYQICQSLADEGNLTA